MAFRRIATLNISQIYSANKEGKFEWRSFVKQANSEPNADRTNFLPKEAYKYDTDHFLFLTARAISGMEKHGHNGNYDAFPWEEIKKAMKTYPGVGFYIEHKEDDENDAKGIVLDVYPNEEEQYLVALCAIDKNEYPEFCQQILDGTYNQVSMSCLASSCECSLCHNVATSFEELCEHMNPNMPITYMKGKKDSEGNDIYEINRDLNFTGLSAVAVPADKDAFVFDVKASKKKVNQLNEEFVRYSLAKRASKMKELKTACQEEFSNMETSLLLAKMKELADSIINSVLYKSDRPEIQEAIIPILEQMTQLQVGLSLIDLQELQNAKSVEITETVVEQPIIEEKALPEIQEDIECADCETINKEIESYDNWSYTPFSSTSSLKKKVNKDSDIDLSKLISKEY